MYNTSKKIYTLENNIVKYIYIKYIHDKNTGVSYKNYIQNIFDLERKIYSISQTDVLDEDLKQMSLADKQYQLTPNKFNKREYKSFPDILRCSYIRKSKHKYYRCKCKILNNETNMCKIHENSINIYLDKYKSIVEKH